jgi:glyoxylate reductase
MVNRLKNRVFVTRRIPSDGLKIIEQEFDTSVWLGEAPPSKNEIIQNAAECDGIVTLLSDPIGADVIKQLPNLKVIAQYAVGYDNIDLKYATERKIIVTNTPGVLTETTADLTWALIMSASRRIVEADRYVREGHWKVAWSPELLLGSDVYGTTLGIIGMGRIGRAVSRRAYGFNMNILYTSRTTKSRDRELEEQLGAHRVDMQTLLRTSDIVTLHVPLTLETTHLIGRTEIAMMKPGSILINTSRGQVIDEDALYNALHTGHLGAAGLDVFNEEPIGLDSPLLQLENVVLAPHIGSASTHTRSVMSLMCAENLRAALTGKVPPNIVNPEVL